MAEDVDRVEKLLRGGMPQYLIAKTLDKPMRTVERYIARVHARWRTNALARQEHAVEERLEHHRRLANQARKQGNWNACARFEKEINLMLGVYAPEKHAHAVLTPHGAPAQSAPVVDWRGAPDSLLDIAEKLFRGLVVDSGVPQLPPAVENAPSGSPSANGEGSEE